MPRILRGLFAFLTLRLMLLPLTLLILFAVCCFVWFRPSPAAPAEAPQEPTPAAQPVPVVDSQPPAAATGGFFEAVRGFSAGWRVLIWLVAVGGLPFATARGVQWVLKRDSNGANAALLAGYTAVALLLALLLMGFQIAGAWEIVIVFVATILAGLYNFVACDWLAERLQPA